MNIQSNAMTESSIPSQGTPAAMSAAQAMYWSIRRELWENRSIYLGPLVVAGVALFGFCLSSFVGIWEEPLRLNPGHIQTPFDMAAGLMMLTGIVVSVFYCLDALYGERRDRSILFWKSLPVSDLKTVLSKAAIPFVLLPLIGFALSVATQLILLLWSTAVLMGSGMSPAPLWAELRLLEMPVTLVYGIGAFALWHAPMYGWLLMVSAWAKRTPILWAVLPIVAISVVERVTFQTSYFGSLMMYRFMGAMTAAFNVKAPAKGHYEIIDRFDQLNPLKFLGTSGVWLGLLLAAAFLAAAVRLRRYREPIG